MAPLQLSDSDSELGTHDHGVSAIRVSEDRVRICCRINKLLLINVDTADGEPTRYGRRGHCGANSAGHARDAVRGLRRSDALLLVKIRRYLTEDDAALPLEMCGHG